MTVAVLVGVDPAAVIKRREHFMAWSCKPNAEIMNQQCKQWLRRQDSEDSAVVNFIIIYVEQGLVFMTFSFIEREG